MKGGPDKKSSGGIGGPGWIERYIWGAKVLVAQEYMIRKGRK